MTTKSSSKLVKVIPCGRSWSKSVHLIKIGQDHIMWLKPNQVVKHYKVGQNGPKLSYVVEVNSFGHSWVRVF